MTQRPHLPLGIIVSALFWVGIYTVAGAETSDDPTDLNASVVTTADGETVLVLRNDDGDVVGNVPVDVTNRAGGIAVTAARDSSKTTEGRTGKHPSTTTPTAAPTPTTTRPAPAPVEAAPAPATPIDSVGAAYIGVSVPALSDTGAGTLGLLSIAIGLYGLGLVMLSSRGVKRPVS